MIDIHTHIIPEFDDGAKSWEEAEEMLHQAAEDGVEGMVATPHILNDKDFAREDELLEKFQELQRRAVDAALNIELFLGSEVYAYPEMTFGSSFATLNDNGRYFLVEFPMNTVPVFIPERFFNFVLNGLIPIIAHPERNLSIIKNPQQAYDFVQRGALLQINAGSLRGVFGQSAQKTSELFMHANLVHFVASDAHSPNNRHPRLRETYEMVAHGWGVQRARNVFVDNPKKALVGEEIKISEPVMLENVPRKKKGMREFLSRRFRAKAE